MSQSPDRIIRSCVAKFRMLVHRRETTMTTQEMSSLIRASFAGVPGVAPPGRLDVEDMEADPMSAKFAHIVMYGMVLGMKTIQRPPIKRAARPMKKKKNVSPKLPKNRVPLDRMMDGDTKVRHMVIYADGPDGVERFDLYPSDESAHLPALLRLVDLTWRETMDVLVKTEFGDED